MNEVQIHTDGACSGNPGPGGWGTILQFYRDGVFVTEKELSGNDPHTTNNRMEMLAVIEGLKALTKPCTVHIFTDSQLITRGMNEWMENWIKRGKLTSPTTDLKNAALWNEILELSKQHTVTWNWVKGHSGNVMNERCDAIARGAIIHKTK